MLRRAFIQPMLAATGLAALSPRLRAADVCTAAPRKRFIFVIARGGWDPLLTLVPPPRGARFDLPPQSAGATEGGLPFVDSPLRPSVRRFFELHAARTVVLHGLAVRSVSHDVCERTLLTGAATGDAPDLGTRLAAASPLALPHLVVEGPSLPGPLAGVVTRAGSGQLQGLLDGTLPPRAAGAPPALARPTRALLDDFRARRLAAFADSTGRAEPRAMAAALDRRVRLEDLRDDLSFESDGSLDAQARLAVAALANDVASCVTISPPTSWDTHTDSDNRQSQLWEGLFGALLRLLDRLHATPAPGYLASTSLADETVVVALSEMARTPRLNADNGRDHWPWTSALLVGPGLAGGRALGGYDAAYTGLGVDPLTGALDPSAAATTPAQLAATLKRLAGCPEPPPPGVAPLLGALA
jgi:uncharacterized protein (DUF1501 family)